MSTAHNEAPSNAFAKTVLMPGDPRRSEYIAKNFLQDAVLVNDVRGVHGYTGTYEGTRVSVMASGMGIPSIGIYSWELYSAYDVDNIIRIGSAGALQDNINLMDIVVAQGACFNTAYISNFGMPGTFCPIADYTLMTKAIESAQENNCTVRVGNILSSDNFYAAFPDTVNAQCFKQWQKMGIMAVEMEAAGLYTNAAYFGKRALCLCTISDHFFKAGELSPEERQTGFNDMIKVALETAVKMEQV